MDDRELRTRALAMAVEHSAKGLGMFDVFELAQGFYSWIVDPDRDPDAAPAGPVLLGSGQAGPRGQRVKLTEDGPEFVTVLQCPPVMTSDHRAWQCDGPVGHEGPHRNGDLEWWVAGEVLDRP